LKYRRDGDAVIWQIPLNKYRSELVYVGRRRRLSRIARQYGTSHAAGGTVLYALNTGIPVQPIYTKEGLHYDYKGDVLFYQDKSGKHKIFCLPEDKYLGYRMWDMVWGFGVVAQLVKDGRVDLRYRTDWLHGLVKTRHPRTAYGVRGDEFIVVTIDGRRYGRGMTGPELAEYMASLDCDLAVMPDGGGSSEALVNGKIVNRPSDGRERPQPAALLFIAKGTKNQKPGIELNINRLLKFGTRGDDVKRLQEALSIAGFSPGPADGIFGPMTHWAVKRFQRKHNLLVDGIVGPQTIGKLREVIS